MGKRYDIISFYRIDKLFANIICCINCNIITGKTAACFGSQILCLAGTDKYSFRFACPAALIGSSVLRFVRIGFCGVHKEIAACRTAYICDDTIVDSIVVTDGWRINSKAVWSLCRQGKLTVSAEDMVDLFPVDKVCAVVKGKPGEIFKAAGYQIKVASDSAYAWCRMESRKDGVRVFHMFLTPLIKFCYNISLNYILIGRYYQNYRK